MKTLLIFATGIMSVRSVVIGMSLAQTTLWAGVLGLEGFGMAAAFVSAQGVASLIGRAGTDNLIVRQYKKDPQFAARFLGLLVGIVCLTALVGGGALWVIQTLIPDAGLGHEGVIFVFLVLAWNLSFVLSSILVAQKRVVTASLLGSALPVAVSVTLFAVASPTLDNLPLSGPMVAIGFLGLGHLISAVVLALQLRAFLLKCMTQMSVFPLRLHLVLGPGQWFFLGYQSMGLARGAGMTLVIAALFGPTETGIFALALRFGSLLAYLNEPARMFTMPRVVGKGRVGLARLYRQMLVLNAALGVAGIGLLAGGYILLPLPFPTDPPFLQYTLIIMSGAALNLFVGPVGVILAMSGNEQNNFLANLWGLGVVVACALIAAITGNAVFAVIGVAGSSLITNLINTVKLLTTIWVRE